MSNVYFCSDLHLDQDNIGEYRRDYLPEPTVLANAVRIMGDWNRTVGKRDVVYLLGDIVFRSPTHLEVFKRLKGRKILVRGNHDELKTRQYLEVFEDVCGLVDYHEFYLSHAPVHELQLRQHVNIHGHVHRKTLLDPRPQFSELPDPRYFNACPEALWPLVGRCLVRLDEVRSIVAARQRQQVGRASVGT